MRNEVNKKMKFTGFSVGINDRGIYEIFCSNGLRGHDIENKFHKYYCTYSKVL
jgi:hypothetical protein